MKTTFAKPKQHALKLYRPLEARIKKSDLEALLARWEFGRKLLEERDGSERLPNGRLAQLANALASSRAELKNRMQFAQQYPSKARVSVAFKKYGSWSSICAEGMGDRGSSVQAASADGESFDAYVANLADLKPHPRNYKQHPPDQLAHIVRSIEAVGIYRPVVVANDNTILAGQGLVQAARQMGRTHVPVLRLDLAPCEPGALKILAGDNELGHGSDRDPRALTELLKEVKDKDDLLGTGYDEMQLANLVHTTRMRSEVPDFDAAAEWTGMPEYDRAGTPIRLIITFPTEADRAQYVEEHRVRIMKHSDTLKVWSARWPEVERNDLSALKWTTGENAPVPLVGRSTELISGADLPHVNEVER